MSTPLINKFPYRRTSTAPPLFRRRRDPETLTSRCTRHVRLLDYPPRWHLIQPACRCTVLSRRASHVRSLRVLPRLSGHPREPPRLANPHELVFVTYDYTPHPLPVIPPRTCATRRGPWIKPAERLRRVSCVSSSCCSALAHRERVEGKAGGDWVVIVFSLSFVQRSEGLYRE